MFEKHRVNVIWGVILACILVLGIAWFIWFRNSTPANRNAPLSTTNSAYLSAQKEANNLATNQQYDQAASVWITFAGKTTSNADESQAYLNAAAAYISAGQPKQALVMCKKSEAIEGITFDESEIAATTYTALGNDSEAIYYYQKAIALSPKKLIDTPGNIANFKQAIAELQAQEAQGQK